MKFYTTGNVNPGPIVQLFKTWREPDADEKQKRLDATRAVIAKRDGRNPLSGRLANGLSRCA